MAHKPLEGIRVLEIAAYISGPYAGAILASLGAEVVKIEPPEGEAFRRKDGNRSAYFVQYNVGKKSVALDLKAPAAIGAIKAMLPGFDVLIENMRPGKMDQLGLGAAACRAINPRLIYTSVSGFGSGGPLVDRPAYDSIGQSIGGLYSILNDPGDVRLSGTCMADLITAINVALGILGALVGRGAAGKGVHVETSVMEAVSTITIDALTQAFDENLDPVRQTRHPQAQNFCLRTASGDSITMHLSSSEKFWRALLRATGRVDLLADPRFTRFQDRVVPEHYFVIKGIMEAEFVRHSREEWERRLTEADVPFAPALTIREVAAHPQTEWLGMMDESDNGRALVRAPWRFDGTRPTRDHHAPHVGEHTREVLADLLGAAAAAALIGAGAAVAPPAAA
jgi:formyl-CoA transferase